MTKSAHFYGMLALMPLVVAGCQPKSRPPRQVFGPRAMLENKFAEEGTAAIPYLRNKLRSGSRDEKHIVLDIFSEHKLMPLFPDVVAVITDNAPRSTDWRNIDNDFVGRRAIPRLISVARPLGFELEKPGNLHAFSLHNELATLPTNHEDYRNYADFEKLYEKRLGAIGRNKKRLREIQKNWERWWRENARAKPLQVVAKPAFPVPFGELPVLASRQSGPFLVSVRGHREVMAARPPQVAVELKNTSAQPLEYGPDSSWQYEQESAFLVDTRGNRKPIVLPGVCGTVPPGVSLRPPPEILQPGETKYIAIHRFPDVIATPGNYKAIVNYKLSEPGSLETLEFPLRVNWPSIDLVERAIAEKWQPKFNDPNVVRLWLYQGKWKVSSLQIGRQNLTHGAYLKAKVEFARGFKLPAKNAPPQFQPGWFQFRAVTYHKPPESTNPIVTGFEMKLPDGREKLDM